MYTTVVLQLNTIIVFSKRKIPKKVNQSVSETFPLFYILMQTISAVESLSQGLMSVSHLLGFRVSKLSPFTTFLVKGQAYIIVSVWCGSFKEYLSFSLHF